MLNPIKEIVRWQRDAGNAAKPYEDFLESSFQIEEALEGFDLVLLTSQLYPVDSPVDSPEDCNAKFLSRQITTMAGAQKLQLADVDRLDKACKAVTVAIGSMTKLGLESHDITKALCIHLDKENRKDKLKEILDKRHS